VLVASVSERSVTTRARLELALHWLGQSLRAVELKHGARISPRAEVMEDLPRLDARLRLALPSLAWSEAKRGDDGLRVNVHITLHTILSELAQRVQRRATAQGKRLRVDIDVDIGAFSQYLSDIVLWTLIDALEEYLNTLVDRVLTPYRDTPGQIFVVLRDRAEGRLEADVEHNATPLHSEHVHQALTQAGVVFGDDAHDPHRLVDWLLRSPDALDRLPEGPGLAIVAAQLRVCGGGVVLAADYPGIRLWVAKG